MRDYDASSYGERIADVYDDWVRDLDASATVATLAHLAGTGPVLELGVGTGRIAVPLFQRGLEVHGIDASPAMLAKLRNKENGDHISVTLGDLADVAVAHKYSLVFAVASTFFVLLTQEEQVRCFANVAAHLLPDGVFVLEAYVPGAGVQPHAVSVTSVELDSVKIQVSRHDPARQRIDGQAIEFVNGGVRLAPMRVRYAWPSELDLMARLAGLRLRARWGGWGQELFTSESTRHVSVYEASSLASGTPSFQPG